MTYLNAHDAEDAISAMDKVQMKGQVIRVKEVEESEEDSEHEPAPAPTTTDVGNVSTCVLVNNMFDSNSEEAQREGYFEEIQAEITDMVEDFGIVEKVWVEPKSAGNVWIKYAQESLKGAEEAVRILNKKKFDNREIRAYFVSPAVFNSKVVT